MSNLTRAEAAGASLPSKQRSGKEFAVLVLVEPGALDVEEFEAGDAARECERVDRSCAIGLLVCASGL